MRRVAADSSHCARKDSLINTGQVPHRMSGLLVYNWPCYLCDFFGRAGFFGFFASLR